MFTETDMHRGRMKQRGTSRTPYNDKDREWSDASIFGLLANHRRYEGGMKQILPPSP